MLDVMRGKGHGCYLTNIPAELRVQILHHITEEYDGIQTLRQLSQTCTHFFHLFKHELYHNVTLRADAKSGRSIQRITAGPRAGLVKRLIFRARDPRPAWERKHDSRHQLSIPSKQVFLLLHRFPNLLEVEFDVEWKLDLWFSEHPEPRLYPVNGYSETYRFILDEALRALGRSIQHNNARILPRLTLRKLPPRTYRALVDRSLHAFLNNLHSLRIEFPVQYSQPASPAYHKFIARLNTYFLDHLNNVRELNLESTPELLIGESHGTPKIDFKDVRMRCLRKLTLTNFILGRETENFILRHLGSLRGIDLQDCYRDQNWSTFFRRIVARKPSKLTKFEVSSSKDTNYLKECLPRDKNQDDSNSLTQSSKYQNLCEHKVFPRVRVYCGHIWDGTDDESQELIEKHSLVAWHHLQSIVQANKRCWDRFSQNRAGHRSGKGLMIG